MVVKLEANHARQETERAGLEAEHERNLTDTRNQTDELIRQRKALKGELESVIAHVKQLGSAHGELSIQLSKATDEKQQLVKLSDA